MNQAANNRLTPNELLAYGQQRLTHRDGASPMLLAVRLNRSDHLGALSGSPQAALVLEQVASRVAAHLQADDRYALASHDEAWILLTCIANMSEGVAAVERLRAELLRPIEADALDCADAATAQLAPVFGGAWTHDASVGIGALLQSAWDARAQAATLDENVSIRELGVDDAAARQAELNIAVRRALLANELEVHFQPQLDLGTGLCVAAEALIRWPRDHALQVSASQIVSVCNATGMMGQLTQFVVNSALRHQLHWRARGLDIKVGINLSASSIRDAAFAKQVAASCAAWKVPPQSLLFELTEDAIVSQEHSTIKCIHALLDLGCELTIDDFGTGYSSVADLRRFPVHELKIDRSFVQNLHRDSNDLQVVKALIDLAHACQLRALAEGVEDVETEQILREMGCDRTQGFLYSRAMPAEQFANWVAHSDREAVSSIRAAQDVSVSA